MGSEANNRKHLGEVFSIKLFLIIASVHLLAIPAFFSVNAVNVVSWLAAHLIFGTIGASIGLHRYCSHRSFEFKSERFKLFISLMATLCFQGGPVFWAAAHREHHRHSEKIGDPHDARRGFFWSHVGWMFYLNPNGFSYIKSLRITADLKKDKIINFLEINNLIVNILFLCSLCILTQAIGHPDLFFWIGPLRIVSVWHSTWLINSYSHGAKLFRHGPTRLKNSIFMALIIGGDGDHLYHHNSPSSIKHSNRKWHFDYGYLVLVLLKKMGLVDFNADRKPISVSLKN